MLTNEPNLGATQIVYKRLIGHLRTIQCADNVYNNGAIDAKISCVAVEIYPSCPTSHLGNIVL